MFKKLLLLLGVTHITSGCLSNPNYSLTYQNSINIPVHWMKELSTLPYDKILDFGNIPNNMSVYSWIKYNTWSIEEWKKDKLTHFKTYYDTELNCTSLRIDVHKYDGDGSSKLNYYQGDNRVRQEIKVDSLSNKDWKIFFGDKIHMNFGIKLSKDFKYSDYKFYHIFQLKPFNDASHMPIFTVSVIKDYFYLSFNTIQDGAGTRPVFTLFKISHLDTIINRWLNIDIFFNPVEIGNSEIYFIVRDLNNVILHVNYLLGKMYVNKNSFVRPKIGQYHRFTNNIQKTNTVYYSHIYIKKLKCV